MGKSVANSVLDGALNIIKNNCVLMTVCTSEPTNYATATTNGSNKLADVVMSSGDFTAADGDVSGRKLTVAAKTAFAVDATGTALHVALCDGSALLYVTTCTSQALTSGNTVSTPAWDIELADPS